MGQSSVGRSAIGEAHGKSRERGQQWRERTSRVPTAIYEQPPLSARVEFEHLIKFTVRFADAIRVESKFEILPRLRGVSRL